MSGTIVRHSVRWITPNMKWNVFMVGFKSKITTCPLGLSDEHVTRYAISKRRKSFEELYFATWFSMAPLSLVWSIRNTATIPCNLTACWQSSYLPVVPFYARFSIFSLWLSDSILPVFQESPIYCHGQKKANGEAYRLFDVRALSSRCHERYS